MKVFVTPFVDVKKFDVMDVLTASTIQEEEDTKVYIDPCI